MIMSAILKCKMCGGKVYVDNNTGVAKCESCGNIYYVADKGSIDNDMRKSGYEFEKGRIQAQKEEANRAQQLVSPNKRKKWLLFGFVGLFLVVIAGVFIVYCANKKTDDIVNTNILDSEVTATTEGQSSLENEKCSSFIVDEADILTKNEIELLTDKAKPMAQQMHFDIAVVLVKDHGDLDIRSFTDNYYDNNGYQKDGIMLLLSMDKREWAMSTSGVAIDKISDESLDNIRDAFIPYLKDGDYYNAFDTFITNVIAIIEFN